MTFMAFLSKCIGFYHRKLTVQQSPIRFIGENPGFRTVFLEGYFVHFKDENREQDS